MNQIKICHDNGIMSRRKLIIYQPFSNDFPSKKPRYSMFIFYKKQEKIFFF